MIRVICVYTPQSGKPDIQKSKFYDELVHEWDLKGTKELTLGIEDFNGHVGKKVDGFEGVHGGNRIEEQNLEATSCWNFAIRRIYVWHLHGLRRRRKGK